MSTENDAQADTLIATAHTARNEHKDKISKPIFSTFDLCYFSVADNNVAALQLALRLAKREDADGLNSAQHAKHRENELTLCAFAAKEGYDMLLQILCQEGFDCRSASGPSVRRSDIVPLTPLEWAKKNDRRQCVIVLQRFLDTGESDSRVAVLDADSVVSSAIKKYGSVKLRNERGQWAWFLGKGNYRADVANASESLQELRKWI